MLFRKPKAGKGSFEKGGEKKSSKSKTGKKKGDMLNFFHVSDIIILEVLYLPEICAPGCGKARDSG